MESRASVRRYLRLVEPKVHITNSTGSGGTTQIKNYHAHGLVTLQLQLPCAESMVLRFETRLGVSSAL